MPAMAIRASSSMSRDCSGMSIRGLLAGGWVGFIFSSFPFLSFPFILSLPLFVSSFVPSFLPFFHNIYLNPTPLPSSEPPPFETFHLTSYSYSLPPAPRPPPFSFSTPFSSCEGRRRKWNKKRQIGLMKTTPGSLRLVPRHPPALLDKGLL